MKRKTLAERAGETSGNTRSHLPKTGLGASRANSYRNTSNTSTSSSASSMRQTSRTTGLRQAQAAKQQVAAVDSAMDTDEEAEAGVMGKRKGTPLISLAPLNNERITLRKTRTHGDLRQHYKSDDPRLQHSGSYTNGCGSRGGSMREHTVFSCEPSLTLRQHSTDRQPFRNDSLTTAFAGLSLPPQHQLHTSGPRRGPSPERNREAVSPSKIPVFARTPPLRHTQSAQQTPSPLKDKSCQIGLCTPVKSAKRKLDPLPRYLTKETLTSVPAWDTKGRLEDMVSHTEETINGEEAYPRQESLYAMLRTQFASAADSKTALEESLSIYKSRGLSSADQRLLKIYLHLDSAGINRTQP
jgi:hypothetical protein